MNFKLKVWRQPNAASPGAFKDYSATEIPSEASLLEMLDIVNETLTGNGEEPIAFDSDCREGICGMCSLVINGIAHGPGKGTTCQSICESLPTVKRSGLNRFGQRRS